MKKDKDFDYKKIKREETKKLRSSKGLKEKVLGRNMI